MAWRNNTFSNHVHVGIRGADRAVAVCDALRPVLPVLLAASANSPWVEERFSGLHSARTRDLHPHVPALRRPGPLRQLGGLRGLRRLPLPDALDRRAHADLVERPAAPHASGRSRSGSWTRSRCAGESTALLALATACVAQAALDYDAGPAPEACRPADRGELLAGDPLRARRQADRPRAPVRRSRPCGGRAPAGVDRGRARRARRSTSTWRTWSAARRRERRPAPVARATRRASRCADDLRRDRRRHPRDLRRRRARRWRRPAERRRDEPRASRPRARARRQRAHAARRSCGRGSRRSCGGSRSATCCSRPSSAS